MKWLTRINGTNNNKRITKVHRNSLAVTIALEMTMIVAMMMIKGAIMIETHQTNQIKIKNKIRNKTKILRAFLVYSSREQGKGGISREERQMSRNRQ